MTNDEDQGKVPVNLEEDYAPAPGAQPVVTPASLNENYPPAPGTQTVIKQPFDPGKWREGARVGIAVGLLGLLAFTVLLIVVATLFFHFPADDADGLFCALLSPLVGLVGAATGFYYGGKEADR